MFRKACFGGRKKEETVGYVQFKILKNFLKKVLPFFFDLCYTDVVKRQRPRSAEADREWVLDVERKTVCGFLERK